VSDNVIEDATEDALSGVLRSRDVSEGDPLRGVVEAAEDARTALSLWLWKMHYEWDDEADAVLSEEEADQILIALFPHFKKIVVAAQRKVWAEGAVAGWNAAKQNTAFPEAPDFDKEGV
jgi:hypothetical protein